VGRPSLILRLRTYVLVTKHPNTVKQLAVQRRRSARRRRRFRHARVIRRRRRSRLLSLWVATATSGVPLIAWNCPLTAPGRSAYRSSTAHSPQRDRRRESLTEIAYDDRGLVPVVVQDAGSGEVLTLAYANAEAVAMTLSTKELHLWSRSRAELWHKGATSGNTQKLVALRLDCDADALLAVVEPAGPACHTGSRTCFNESVSAGEVPHEALPALERVLVERAAERPEGSYSVELLGDPNLAAAKVREEAEEVGRAVLAESDERVDEEAADLLFHLTALLHSRGHTLAEAQRVLLARRQ